MTAGAASRLPMFRDRRNTIATVTLGVCLAWITWRLVSWAIVHATWTLPAGADSTVCRDTRAYGACWAIVTERWRFMLFGVYPFAQQWRPALTCGLFALLYLASARRQWWTRWLLACWLVVPAVAIVLLRGGMLGLTSVPSDAWGGLPLTLLLSTIGFVVALPLGIVFALGRRSPLPAIRGLSIAYIEIVRGVPLITFLFMAAVMFPLFVPQTFTIDKWVRAEIAFVMVAAAYLAEVVRGGLQAVPSGQYEAAASVGLSFWPTTLLVVLPQALRVSIPALVNTFIAQFKDTSLVIVIGLFDLLGAAKTVIVDRKWIGFGVEVYLFVATVYFVFCYAVSRYSQALERRLLMERSS